MQVTVVAIYLFQSSGHLTVAAPEHAVAAKDDAREAHTASLCQLAQLLLAGVCHHHHLVASYPILFSLAELCFHLDAAQRFEQIVWQFLYWLARLSLVLT